MNFDLIFTPEQSESYISSTCCKYVEDHEIPLILTVPTLVLFEGFEDEVKVTNFNHPANVGSFIADTLSHHIQYNNAVAIFDAVSGMACVIFSMTGDVKMPDIASMDTIGNA